MQPKPLLLEMLILTAGNYRITITNDPTYTFGSADNVHIYDHVHRLDNAHDNNITSRHAVCVTENDDVIASCMLLTSGGVSSVHEHSAIFHDNSCIIAIGPVLASLRIPTLELEWTTKTDAATCFGVYYSEKHRCFVSHGELEISCVSLDGNIVWKSSGADIFTNGFTLLDDCVHVLDWNNREYYFDIETGREDAI